MENSYEKAKKQDVSNTLNQKTVQNKAKELQDNRASTSVLSNNNASVKQLKSNEAIANFNSNVVQLARGRGVTFTLEQRLKKLAANKKKNKGFHTCTNCSFQHTLIHYATYQGNRMGDGQFHIDHIQPASQGGRNGMRNGRVLCGTCNTSRGNRAASGLTGIEKYSALHRKKAAKDYKRKPNKKNKKKKK